VRGKTRGDKPKPGGRPKAKAPKTGAGDSAGDGDGHGSSSRPKFGRPTKGTSGNIWEKRPKNRVTRKRNAEKRKGG
jgi:hypothetical protein